MGVKSTGNQHPTTTKADGHLLSYSRDTFVEGGGAAFPLPAQQVTGGTHTYENGYHYHVFTSTGSITNDSGSAVSAEYFVIAGGGGGGPGSNPVNGGGGGAGGYRTGSTTLPTAEITVTVGGGGAAGTQGGPGGLSGPVTVTSTGGGKGGSPGGGGNGGSGGGGGTHHQHLRHRVMMVAMEPLLTLPGVLAVVEVLEVLVVMDLGPKVVQEEQQLKHQQTGDLPLHMELLVLEVLQEIIMQEVVEVR